MACVGRNSAKRTGSSRNSGRRVCLFPEALTGGWSSRRRVWPAVAAAPVRYSLLSSSPLPMYRVQQRDKHCTCTSVQSECSRPRLIRIWLFQLVFRNWRIHNSRCAGSQINHSCPSLIESFFSWFLLPAVYQPFCVEKTNIWSCLNWAGFWDKPIRIGLDKDFNVSRIWGAGSCVPKRNVPLAFVSLSLSLSLSRSLSIVSQHVGVRGSGCAKRCKRFQIGWVEQFLCFCPVCHSASFLESSKKKPAQFKQNAFNLHTAKNLE